MNVVSIETLSFKSTLSSFKFYNTNSLFPYLQMNKGTRGDISATKGTF